MEYGRKQALCTDSPTELIIQTGMLPKMETGVDVRSQHCVSIAEDAIPCHHQTLVTSTGMQIRKDLTNTAIPTPTSCQ